MENVKKYKPSDLFQSLVGSLVKDGNMKVESVFLFSDIPEELPVFLHYAEKSNTTIFFDNEDMTIYPGDSMKCDKYEVYVWTAYLQAEKAFGKYRKRWERKTGNITL